MPKYCLNCKSTKVRETVEENRVYYYCPDCQQKSGKALIIDGRIKIINTDRGIKHVDVAAIIIKDKNILLTDRRTYPFGLEIPVGHLEYNETVNQALVREVYEEVGLKVRSATLLSQVEQPISYCRYGSAIEEWIIFIVECEGTEYVGNDENETVKWYPLHDLPIKKLTEQTAFALSHTGYISL
jgi:mutator protein MutT